VDENGIKNKIRRAITGVLKTGITSSPTDLATMINKRLEIADEKWLHYTLVELINDMQKNDFLKIQKENMAVFIPHCLRSMNSCKAKNTEEGYICARCGQCKIKDIVEMCEERGLRHFIVGGGKQVINIQKKYDFKGVIGIACFAETQLALEKLNIPCRAILLKKDGCVNTEADLEDIKRVLDMVHV